MEFTALGRTGLEVSVAGLGCGGPSRLGRSAGRTEDESIAVVHTALDLGINVLDTSQAYGTEEIVGKAIAGRRDDVVLATKVVWIRDGALATAEQIQTSLEGSLRRLGTDHLDIYFLHGVTPDGYQPARDTLVPLLQRLREAGKVRFFGVTERFGGDTGHRMLERALQDDWLDVVMVGFNVLNPSARDRVFPRTQANGVGTLNMFAVRRALSRPERLRETIADLVSKGLIDADLDAGDPLGFLVHEGGATSMVDAAYRFCRHEPGVDVVLTGTGSVEHLKENVASMLRPPLPTEDADRLRAIFARVDSVSGN